MEKGEIAKMSNLTFFHNISMQSVSKNPLIATFQLSSAASLNSGWSQNGILGNGLKKLSLCRKMKIFRYVIPLPDMPILGS